jgi:hypothetical protein
MRLKIETGDYRESVVFPITGIGYELDEYNHPVDIVIYGEKHILEEISEFARIGFNMQPLDDYLSRNIRMKALGATHECLCARLPKFEVLGALRCIYQ